MSLLSLDHAVWQDILLNWLGSLRAIVRLDFAVDAADIKNQFRDVFAQLAFPLPVTVRVTQDLLVDLCSWMQSRNVYLNRVEVKEYFVEWDAVFAWCRGSLKKLYISGSGSGSSNKEKLYLLNAIAKNCQALQELTLTNGRYQSGDSLRTILQNNSSTLVVLSVEDEYACSAVNLDNISCPNLQVLVWESEDCAGLGAFLGRCPNLHALSVTCEGDHVPQFLLISALADYCPALRRLRLYEMQWLDSNSLLRIARGHSQLEHLELFNYSGSLLENIVELMQTLPHLHTLGADAVIYESDWLEIAVRGLAPSLRVLDVFTQFTCTGFRQFTAAYPHLIGLKLNFIGLDINIDNKTLFEHCGELKHLVLDMYDEERDAVDAVLESVALCCPDLKILELLKYGTQCSTWALQRVLDNCTQVKHLVTHCERDGKLIVPDGVTVSDAGFPLAKWLPAKVL